MSRGLGFKQPFHVGSGDIAHIHHNVAYSFIRFLLLVMSLFHLNGSHKPRVNGKHTDLGAGIIHCSEHFRKVFRRDKLLLKKVVSEKLRKHCKSSSLIFSKRFLICKFTLLQIILYNNYKYISIHF